MALAEKTIPKPLSGHEVVDAIIHGLRVAVRKQAPKVPQTVMNMIAERLKTQMRRDCYLNNIISYSVYASETTARISYQPTSQAFFEFSATIKIEFPATGTGIKNTTIVFNSKNAGPNPEQDIESADVVSKDVPRAPNVVRVETQQDIPVIVQKPQGGVEEKRVRYAPKTPKAEKVRA